MTTLESLRSQFGEGAGARKRALVERLGARRLQSAAQVLRYHEALSFLHAYPDDRALHRSVERELARFATRPDLRNHRAALADSGIAGTATRFRFFAPTAFWLAQRCPAQLRIDWARFVHRDRLELFLPLLALAAERAALEEYAGDARHWISRLKGSDETDAHFLAQSFAALPMPSPLRETLWDELDPPLILAPAANTPTRTGARHRRSPAHFVSGLQRERPDLALEVERPPLAVRVLAAPAGRALVTLARDAMVARQRDLDAFSSGSPHAVCLADCGRGLRFALIGVQAEARWLLESQHGFLILQGGVPIGYGTLAALYGSCAVAFNIFDSFRGAEAAWVFARLLAVARHLLGARTFRVSSYQVGDDNEEAVRSGAFWFYRKLGFAPRDPAARAVLAREEARLQAHPGRRSSPETLRRLARADLFLACEAERDDVLGVAPLAASALAVQNHVASRYAGDRARATRDAPRQAARLLRVSHTLLARRPRAERAAFARWASLVLVLPGIAGWPAADKKALFAIACAKGADDERGYVALFDAHRRLRDAVLALAAGAVTAAL